MFRRRSRTQVFVRQFFTNYNVPTTAPGFNGITDTTILSPAQILGQGADRMAKAIIVMSIDWRSEAVVTSTSTTSGSVIFAECIYKGQQAASGGVTEFTGNAFLVNNELGAAGGTSVSHWPSRIVMRRLGFVGSSGIGVDTNWHPLKVKSKVRLNMDEALWLRTEFVPNSSLTGNQSGQYAVLAAVAYKVIT